MTTSTTMHSPGSSSHSQKLAIEEFEFVILAAGRGKRVGLVDKNKGMLEVGGKPMLEHCVETIAHLTSVPPLVVVGFAKESIISYFGNRVRYAEQLELSGTAGAVQTALPFFRPEAKHVIVFLGDHSMFFTKESVEGLLQYHTQQQAGATLVTARATDPTGFGRIIRSSENEIDKIIEEKVATDQEKLITEINTGNGVYNREFLQKYLPLIERNPISEEFYFTDIVEIGRKHQEHVFPFILEDERFAIGINTLDQLKLAEDVWKAQHE